MQNLSVIVTVIVAAAAIIAVLLWRLKASPAVDIEPFNKRIQEEIQKAEGIQAKLETIQGLLRTAEANCAAAKASETAETLRADTADSKTNQLKSEFDALQKQWNDAEPKIATAVEQKKAAEDARTESVERLLALTTQHTELTSKATSLLERATNSEKDASASAAEAKATGERVDKSDARLTESTANLAAASAEISKHKSLLAEAIAQRISSEDAKDKSEQTVSILSTKHDTLLGEHNTALERAATASADVENARAHMTDMASTIEALQVSLASERKNLAAALAKQQTGEDAVREFKLISQEILAKNLEEAKRGMEELSKSFQKSSGVELEKHADKVAQSLEPLQTKLEAYDKAVKEFQDGSQENYGSMKEQLSKLQETERSLHDQARALTTALSATPKYKGTYGEMALERLLEHAGLQEGPHFEKQARRNTEEGMKIPDVVVKMPGDQKVIVDAKAVMDAYIKAQQIEDDTERKILLKMHSKNVRDRVIDLSAKNYFVDHTDAVELVILFLPAENLYIAAVENDHELADFAMSRNVLVCGPSLLIMLLKSANQLWRRASIEEEASKIKDCADGIHNAVLLFIKRYAEIGTKIDQLTKVYNETSGTMNGNLIPKGRAMSRFTAIANNKEIEDIVPVERTIHSFSSAEAKKLLAISTERLPGLVLGEFETAELTLASGEK